MNEESIDQLLSRVKLSDKRVQRAGPSNQLDATAPSRRRGKEREVPKPKKSTPLRKHIEQPAQQEEEGHQEEDDDDENVQRKRLLHAPKFREFCRQAITAEINRLAAFVLSELVRFQDRAFAKDPVKAKIRRRLGFGMREVEKLLALGKVKAVFLAPDIVANQALDAAVEKLVQQAASSAVPVVFALNRHRLAHVCRKRNFAKVSCVGVFNYDGCNEEFKQLVQLVEEGKAEYERVWAEVRGRTDRGEAVGEVPSLFHRK